MENMTKNSHLKHAEIKCIYVRCLLNMIKTHAMKKCLKSITMYFKQFPYLIPLCKSTPGIFFKAILKLRFSIRLADAVFAM